ncbi:MAG: DUF481 domain-containing protein [Phycisphaerae bacterium]
MKSHKQFGCSAVLLLTYTAVAGADVVVTTDGSRINGTIIQLTDGQLTIETQFAGTLEIPADNITAMQYAEQPEVATVDQREEQSHASSRVEWTAVMEAGLLRTEGNTDTAEARGRLDVARKTEEDLLQLFASADFAEKDGERTRNEYKGGAHYERIINEHWFWYTRFDLEHDEFERLDLRSEITAGAGHYFLKRADHELKARAGLGYRYESFDTDDRTDDVVVDFGLDYRVDLAPWLQFRHSTSFLPNIERINDYRLDFDTALILPLQKEALKLKLGVRNEYNSTPQSGVDRLDNTYYANLMFKLK